MFNLSEQSKAAIEAALQRAAAGTMVLDPADSCVFAPCTAAETVANPGEKLVVVTIASFAFRLLVIFHIGNDPRIARYFARERGSRNTEEAFYEIANLCCGALSREVSRDFTHLAMSIPYTLDSACGKDLADVRPEYVLRRTVTINDAVRLQITLCLCCSGAVSFSTGTSDVVPESGKLEMF